MDAIAGRIDQLVGRLEKIEASLTILVERQAVKDWYATSEVATILGKAEFTVREWCRLGRIEAEKRPCGRGKYQEWMIARAELERLKNEGIRPLGRGARRAV